MMLDKTGWLSILTGAAVAAAGAGLAYLAEVSTGGSLGKLGPIAAAILAVLANTLRKALTAQSAAPAIASAPIDVPSQPIAAGSDPPPSDAPPKTPF